MFGERGPNTPDSWIFWQTHNTPLIGLKLQVNSDIAIAGSWLECDNSITAIQFGAMVKAMLAQTSSMHTMIVFLGIGQVSVLIHSEIGSRELRGLHPGGVLGISVSSIGHCPMVYAASDQDLAIALHFC